MPRVNFEEVSRAAQASSLDLLFRWFPEGRIERREFMIGSIAGEKGRSLSVNIETGKWADFSAGLSGGDLIDLYQAKSGLGPVEAAKAVAADLNLGPAPLPDGALDRMERKRRPERQFEPIMPPPPGKKPPTEHYKYGVPDHVAEVRDQDGILLHVIHRFEASERTDGKKQVIPWTFGTMTSDDGSTSTKWHAIAPPAPRPLYGLPIPAGKRFLIVEGEKKRDAAQRLLAGSPWHAISWPNGFKGIGHAGWTVLAGLSGDIWRDNDPQGLEGAQAIVNVLRGVAEDVRIVQLPDGLPPKWDLADAEKEGWTTAQVVNTIEPGYMPADGGGGANEPPPWEDDGRQEDDGRREPTPPHRRGADAGWPFKALGYDRTRYFFLPGGTGQVTAMTARDLHNSATLKALAPLSWWEGAFPKKKEGIAIEAAGDALMRACEQVGVYDDERLRGRGVWLDDGRTVVHLGDRLLVDGSSLDPGYIDSALIYETERALSIPTAPPASKKEAAGLIKVCCGVAWENPERDGRLLAGWLVIALVCGAMPWRPHAWVTSDAGGGKTWVLDNLIRPTIGSLALRVQGSTTEAGLRGKLKLDARPVIFDEAEGESEEDRKRVQQVLNLARQASSEDGAEVLKGTREGGSMAYRIRSCFVFASINPGLTQAADASRTMQLNIRPSLDAKIRSDAFRKLKEDHKAIMTPEFPARLLARVLQLVPVIRANAETLADAIARDGVSRRTGDTLGVILAGAYSLTSEGRLTVEEAERFIASRDWVRAAAKDAEAEPEWSRVLTKLMQYEIRFTSGNGRPEVQPIGALIAAQLPGADTDGALLQPAAATAVLKRHGIRADSIGGGPLEIRILNRSEAAEKAFEGTTWAKSWGAMIERAPGGKRNVAVRFSTYLEGKSVTVPVATAMPDYGENEA